MRDSHNKKRTFIIGFPSLDNNVLKWFAIRVRYLSFNIKILRLSNPVLVVNDRASIWDCKNRKGVCQQKVYGRNCVKNNALSGASGVNAGPSRQLSVAFFSGGLFMVSTNAETPNTSDNRMNSFPTLLDWAPASVKNCIPACHSSAVTLRQANDERQG